MEKMQYSAMHLCFVLVESPQSSYNTVEILLFPGSCQESAIESVKPTLIAGKYHFRINAPFGRMSLFEDPDAAPVYQGKATARGIKCDVWRQTRVNWPGEYKSRMIWRWYFTQSPKQPVSSNV